MTISFHLCKLHIFLSVAFSMRLYPHVPVEFFDDPSTQSMPGNASSRRTCPSGRA